MHHIGFCSKQFQFKIDWHLNVFHGFFRRQRQLLVLGTRSFFIVGKICGSILKRFRISRMVCCKRFIVYAPQDGIVDQLLKPRLVPGSFIMTISGIKNFSLTMCSCPGIRLCSLSGFVFVLISLYFPNCQHIIIRLQLTMQIGFIICSKWL